MATRRRTPAEVPGKVCIGVITGTRGLKGELRIKSFTDVPADVGAYGPVSDETGSRLLKLRVTGEVKGVVIARAEGIGDRDAAEALKGVALYVRRDALPVAGEDEYYHTDLVGLTVVRIDAAEGDEPVGRVKAVFDFGAGDVIEVEAPSGKTVLLPFNHEVVPEIDVAAGRLVVDPLDGLLDAEADEDMNAEARKDDGTKG